MKTKTGAFCFPIASMSKFKPELIEVWTSELLNLEEWCQVFRLASTSEGINSQEDLKKQKAASLKASDIKPPGSPNTSLQLDQSHL